MRVNIRKFIPALAVIAVVAVMMGTVGFNAKADDDPSVNNKDASLFLYRKPRYSAQFAFNDVNGFKTVYRIPSGEYYLKFFIDDPNTGDPDYQPPGTTRDDNGVWSPNGQQETLDPFGYADSMTFWSEIGTTGTWTSIDSTPHVTETEPTEDSVDLIGLYCNWINGSPTLEAYWRTEVPDGSDADHITVLYEKWNTTLQQWAGWYEFDTTIGSIHEEAVDQGVSYDDTIDGGTYYRIKAQLQDDSDTVLEETNADESSGPSTAPPEQVYCPSGPTPTVTPTPTETPTPTPTPTP